MRKIIEALLNQIAKGMILGNQYISNGGGGDYIDVRTLQQS